MTWKNKPSDFTKTMFDDCETHVKKIAMIGLQSVVVSSPVMDGHYRGSHRVSLNSPDNNYDVNSVDLNGNSTLSEGSAQIVKFKLGNNLFIQTNAPHATRLENGWSDQAPKGVYSIAFQKMSTSQ